MDDLELLHRYVANGDKDAISSVIRKYRKMVFSACLRRLGCAADAEDATQQVFIAMMQGAGGINTSVSQWLYRCSINVSASVIRSRKNRVHREREKARHAKAWCGNGEAERNETYAILMQCLGKLDATDQKVLVDNQVNGVTQQVLASSMGVTQQAVAKRLGKIILHLRRELTSKGVIFSLVAAVMLTVKRAASAAIPEGIKAALTSAPSATLATGGAAGAGTAGVLKAGTAAVLVLAAVATYECTHEHPSNASHQSARMTNAAQADRSVSGNVALAGSARGPLSAAAPVAVGTLPGMTAGQQFRPAAIAAAPGGNETPDLSVSRREADLSSNRWSRQELPAGPRSDAVDRTYSFLSSSEFWGTSFSRNAQLLAAKAEKPAKLCPEGTLAGDVALAEASVDEPVELGGAGAADELLSDDASARDGRRFRGKLALLEERSFLKADAKEWYGLREWSRAIDADAVAADVASIWSTSWKRRYADAARMSMQADAITDVAGLSYRAPLKTMEEAKWISAASLSSETAVSISRNWVRAAPLSPENSGSSADDSLAGAIEPMAAPTKLPISLADAVEPALAPARLTILPTAFQPTAVSILPSYSKAITVPAGAELPITGTLDGRLINQGTVVAASDVEPLYLTGLVSGRGSYTGNVVFAGGFSPGNSPAAVYLDYGALDNGNVLTMELAGLTPGKQYDQIVIGKHLTLGGYLDVELIYGFMPRLGDSFTLFDGDFSGKFSGVTLPALNDGLRWDTGSLYTGGNLQVVPEPATMILLIAGGVGLLRRHRPA